MSKKLRARSVIFAALVAAWGVSGSALAVDEVEPNDPVSSAQYLVIGSDGTAQVHGVLGVVSGVPVGDVDFYSFEGKQGDIVTVDIDGGMTTPSTGLDSVLAIFGPNGSNPLFQWRQVDNTTSLDTGSVSKLDARIDNFLLPATGTYVVGVTSVFRSFVNSPNVLASNRLGSNSNGAYTLIISGVTPSIQQINIIIKPDTTEVEDAEVARINPQSGGHIPVALLSSAEFDAMDVDPQTLTFGATGNEQSFERCRERGRDYNGDARLDLVCRFDNRAANFEVGDTEGVIRGKTKSGRQFEGRGWLKVISHGRAHEHGHDDEHGQDDDDHGKR